ncbi:NAD(P)-dependent oxidoreductase [Vibrio sagamiensis]|uniref:3-hydroxyisobutyrate dehydrogenase n=1 Tax=Vibrio sagamiensis NBRC 104589 TaxID=1219064 RepID=A0A511QD32_9VIBR|nr:NAD(P)-dependent oxidoreductase [Vibrio sagamiensis]PNQ66923.1 NAD(P)-dependent oxidoreductase [Vibrio agarivorans]GEM75215.1 3-hydroxyisobutyrate dehydrogenase [Vibrio sagamiensis NBRC 104589]
MRSSNNTVNVAFIGLGVMGYPMAGHLVKNGFNVTVYNRSVAKAEQWVKEYSGQSAATPSQAAQGANVVAVCVGNDNDVRSVIYGDTGVLNSMKSGSVLIDHTTTSAELAQELAEKCAEKGIQFIDAPVSGGQAGAENGSLTIMCGGQQDAFDNVSEVMASYSNQAVLMGENGQGQRCKMVNQICIAGVLKGLSEAVLLAQKSGLDMEQVVSVIKHGAAGSWQMENRAVTMSQDKFDFGFAIDWMRKDLDICLNEAKKNALTLPLTEEVNNQYQGLQERGLGRMDTSVLIKAYDKL